MAKLNPMEDKDFEDRKPWFDLGAHEITITGYETGKTPNTGSEFIEFNVKGTEDQEGTARLYLTEKSVERTRSILATIAVHNKEGEVERQKVRDAFKAITDSDQMLEAKFLDKFKGMQAWVLVEEDTTAPKPNGGFYTRTNLYSYPPNPRQVKASDMTVDNMVAGADNKNIDLSEIPFE